MTTTAEAMHDEEVVRTRLFIRMGSLMSVIAIGTAAFVEAPLAMKVAFVAALVWGMVMGSYYHYVFRDSRNYTESRLLWLGVLSVINAHVAILFYGVFTVAPVIIVIGIHFMARTEAERIGRYIFASAAACYAVITLPIVAGIIADPGVFATARQHDRSTLALGATFVLGTYALAYYTARSLRKTSLSSIEDFRRATQLGSQREALMDELRAELERALRVGGPGRYTDQTVGSFKLGVVIGRGAMGEVYEATHVMTGEPAAVKLLRRELLADPTHIARFLREARASGSLDSPNVVRVLDASSDDAAMPFLAMELLRGQTLAEQLRRDSRVTPSDVVLLCRDVAAGLDAAGAAGIVHRDLKPQNLFHCDAGWKILDFGVATLTEDSGTLTQGGIIGTPNYMAPEQAQGKRVDHRADLYALAAVAYRCLTGRHPFSAHDTPALLYAVVHRMPIRPGELAELTPDLDRWLAIGLTKSPDDRFATGTELTEALIAAVAGELDGKLRKRAEKLIARRPWDTGG